MSSQDTLVDRMHEMRSEIDSLRSRCETLERQAIIAPAEQEFRYGPKGEMRNTHLIDWLDDAYNHCQRGSQEWCNAYLSNARAVIGEQDAHIASLESRLARAEAALEEARLRIAELETAGYGKPVIRKVARPPLNFDGTANPSCYHCNGTGRHQGVFGGPDWPLCSYCGGTGQSARSLSHGEDKTDG